MKYTILVNQQYLATASDTFKAMGDMEKRVSKSMQDMTNVGVAFMTPIGQIETAEPIPPEKIKEMEAYLAEGKEGAKVKIEPA